MRRTTETKIVEETYDFYITNRDEETGFIRTNVCTYDFSRSIDSVFFTIHLIVQMFCLHFDETFRLEEATKKLHNNK